MSVKSLGQAIKDGNIKFKPWLTSFSPEIFEVDFSDVIKGRGSSVYLDPDEFFEITYLTPRMRDVLQWCLARTATLNDKGLIYLATGFGGGKSHLLTLIYHIYTSKKVPDSQLLAEIAVLNVPDTQVVAIDGHNLAYPMSSDAVIGPYVKKTKDETLEAIEQEGSPIVFLIDEFVIYLAKLKEAERTHEMATLHTLISAVHSTENCVIIVTNPRGAAVYGREIETLDAVIKESETSSIASDVSSVLGRVTQPVVPVEKEDFVSILRKRLMDYLDQQVANEVEGYLGRRLPSLDFSDHYPFHPLLIDVLYERVSLHVDFQQTRDVLKVIALAIKELLLHSSNAEYYVLSPADLVFEDPDLRAILTNENVFGSNLEQAVTSDVVKASRHADEGRVYGKYGRVTSTVFLYSLHPTTSKRGVTAKDVYLCLTDAISIDDVELLLSNFYSEYSTFMWLEEGKYLFKAMQNVPNMIKLRANQVIPAEIQKYVEDTLYSTVFQKANNQDCSFYRIREFIPASNRLNVVVPLYWENVDSAISDVLSINARKKNAGIVLEPDTSLKPTLEYYSKYALGASKVQTIVKNEKDLFQEAKKLGQQHEARALQQFKGMYSTVKFLQGTQVRSVHIEPMKGVTIRDVLTRRLKEAGKLVDVNTINPKEYLDSLLGTRNAVQTRDLYDDVETMSTIPYAHRHTLQRVVKDGVYEGSVGLFRGALPENEQLTGKESIHFREEITDVKDGDTVLKSEYALQLIQKLNDVIKVPQPLLPPGISSGPSTPLEPPEPPATPSEEAESFVANVGDLYQILNDKMTELLLSDVEARAEVVFSGNITGKISAKNLEEIRAIIDLADGLSKASMLLGGVKTRATIYKKTHPDSN